MSAERELGAPEREGAAVQGGQRDALLVFLSTLSVALVGLLVLIRLYPDRFGFAAFEHNNAALKRRRQCERMHRGVSVQLNVLCQR